MKRSTLSITLLMVLCSQSIVFAQTTYRTILKDADQAYEGYLGLHYLAVDAGFNNLSGASVWSIGAEGLYPINEKISAEQCVLIS